MIIFIIWTLFGLSAIGLGVYTFKSSRAINVWANIKTSQNVSDVKSYNQALAKLWWIFGLILILVGLPLLSGQNSPLLIITILGTVFDCIFLMIMLRKIEIKYGPSRERGRKW